ncbi:hypothetical protein C8D97_105197 [Pleionea mediterranea]|uniref:Uncharacterized protein n=2 Tax=Pleionea mediterranea TaxID=523701 RepID=A0A316FSZ9_9GAMM|nr:hypothetical protein C8D97_105197 [Pleionea mediterranea]
MDLGNEIRDLYDLFVERYYVHNLLNNGLKYNYKGLTYQDVTFEISETVEFESFLKEVLEFKKNGVRIARKYLTSLNGSSKKSTKLDCIVSESLNNVPDHVGLLSLLCGMFRRNLSVCIDILIKALKQSSIINAFVTKHDVCYRSIAYVYYSNIHSEGVLEAIFDDAFLDELDNGAMPLDLSESEQERYTEKILIEFTLSLSYYLNFAQYEQSTFSSKVRTTQFDQNLIRKLLDSYHYGSKLSEFTFTSSHKTRMRLTKLRAFLKKSPSYQELSFPVDIIISDPTDIRYEIQVLISVLLTKEEHLEFQLELEQAVRPVIDEAFMDSVSTKEYLMKLKDPFTPMRNKEINTSDNMFDRVMKSMKR